MIQLGNDWDELLKEEFQKSYYLDLREFFKSSLWLQNCFSRYVRHFLMP
ncbi:uracil-DNA glycosylase [Listeria aquatica FSL S10-1188]|uniref:Uracil-DNA glycosylase n=1 Tax=Listeria aquatica FSL S10-1188 TaxID=1265818 RepID=W7AU36_9LIST|nr:uracil-DNA glycosylase [Listeria aquatica FSL S10-1188]